MCPWRNYGISDGVERHLGPLLLQQKIFFDRFARRRIDKSTAQLPGFELTLDQIVLRPLLNGAYCSLFCGCRAQQNNRHVRRSRANPPNRFESGESDNPRSTRTISTDRPARYLSALLRDSTWTLDSKSHAIESPSISWIRRVSARSLSIRRTVFVGILSIGSHLARPVLLSGIQESWTCAWILGRRLGSSSACTSTCSSVRKKMSATWPRIERRMQARI